MYKKFLTISVAAYNAEKTLEKCLNSMVTAKNVDDIEIIVVNDGSKDRTLEIARSYAEKYPQSVIVIDKENGGHGSTINASVSRATGKYYKIVDSDDWVETENLEKLVDTLKSDDVDLFVNSYFEADENGNHTNLISASNHIFEENIVYHFEDIALDFTEAHMHKMTFNAELVKKMGPVIDEHCFYVDIEYVGFLLAKVNTVKFLYYPVYDYLLGYEEQSVSKISMIKRREQHKKVVSRMIDFYLSTKDTSNRSEFLRRYISFVTRSQYMIYFNLPVTESKKEFSGFDKIVPDCFFDLPGVGKKMSVLIKLLRIKNYRFYIFLMTILKTLKMI